MTDYSKYATKVNSSEVARAKNPDRFTANNRFSDWDSEAKEIWRPVNVRFAIRDIIAHLEGYELSRQSDIAAGVVLALAQLQPHNIRYFLDQLRASPICADTADRVIESLHFMNSHDRER